MSDSQGIAEVIVGKQRHGPIGKVELSFDANVTRFGNRPRMFERQGDDH
jgi:replicative DNA helicase